MWFIVPQQVSFGKINVVLEWKNKGGNVHEFELSLKLPWHVNRRLKFYIHCRRYAPIKPANLKLPDFAFLKLADLDWRFTTPSTPPPSSPTQFLSTTLSPLLLRHDPQIRKMHIGIELAIRLMTSRHGAMMTSIANRIPTSVGLPARQAPRQIPKPVQLLGVEAAVMAGGAAVVRAFAAEVVIVAVFFVPEPGDDGFHRSDGRVDPLTAGVSEDDGLRSGDVGPMLGVAE